MTTKNFDLVTCVLSSGRSGTNMVLEILRGNSYFNVSEEIENKLFFTNNIVYPPKYLTKCDTRYISNFELITKRFEINPTLKIIWTIRNPKDMIPSKIRRGQSKENGGETNKICDDATEEGCIKELQYMYDCYKFINHNYQDHMLLIKMENIIINIELEIFKMCKFLKIEKEKEMIDFVPRLRKKLLRDRYSKLDKTQIDLWKNWETVYNNYFSINNYCVPKLFKEIDYITKYFNYQ